LTKELEEISKSGWTGNGYDLETQVSDLEIKVGDLILFNKKLLKAMTSNFAWMKGPF
jgi:hypothetical protein